MENRPGVYRTNRKDNSIYYRASFTFRNKHISLGGYDTEDEAHKAYCEACSISSGRCTVTDYSALCNVLPFNKFVSIINFRDNGIYFATPIMLKHKYFEYYFDVHHSLKFDADDLFYYSTHTISRRGGYLYVADYGMQTNILSRYGIRNHSVEGRDYVFANGDNTDFRYGNICIINRYYGVTRHVKNGRECYRARIHVNSYYIIGTYATENEAAIAYNKAIDILKKKGCKKSFPENYPESLSPIDYASIYSSLKISARIRHMKEFED